jgi:hypothetical protein
MTKIIEVPGVGNVEFPSTMTDEEIVEVLQNNPKIPSPPASRRAETDLNASVTGEMPGAPLPRPDFLADVPTPQQVLQDPTSGRLSRFAAGATLGVEQGVYDAASQPLTSVSRWASPLTIPLTAAITGAQAAGVPAQAIKEGGKLIEALMPLGMPGAFPESVIAYRAGKGQLAATIDKYLKLRGVRPPAMEVVTPGVVPVSPQLAQADPIGEMVSRRLDEMAPELRPQMEETYNSISKMSGPEKAAKMLFGGAEEAAPAVTPPTPMAQLAETSLPAGQKVIITRPNYGKINVVVKDTPVAADRAAAETILAEPQILANGTVEYGPILEPANMGVNKHRLVTVWDRTLKYLENLRERLPADPSIVRQAPNSWVLPDLERWQQESGKFMHELVNQPWVKVIQGMDEKIIKDAEALAVQVWEAGGKTSSSYALGVSTMPAELRQYISHRNTRAALEDAARLKLGLTNLDFVEGPYIPRLVNKDFDEIYRIRRGGISLAADVQQTIGKFAKSRVYPTQHAGEIASIEYIPIRHAIIMREFEGMKLVETAKLMDNLAAHRVIFPSQAQALAATGGKAWEIQGLPGTVSQRWWTGSKAEALMLEQNISKANGLGLGGVNHWLNLVFRNLNLLNPLPHFAKNMLYKYELAGGKMGMFGRKLKADMFEFIYETNPVKLAEFKQYFPHNSFGETAQTLMQKAIHDRGVKAVVEKFVNSLNKPSSKALFGTLDPALRYSLWKQKVARGMSPLEAANHVHVDLIRYGTRSDWVDFWKSIPLNFFVPWRVGSVTSVMKQLRDYPVRSALKIGFLDYIRESIYRNTGQYFHMPIDYVTGPIVQSITAGQDKGVGAGLGTAAGLGIVSRIAGPGGAWSAGQLSQALGVFAQKQPVEWDRVVNLWWGLSQLYNVPKAGVDAISKGTPDAIAEDLIKIAGSLLVGSHEAYTYDPHRMGKFLPEWLPGLQKSKNFKMAELIREQLKLRALKGEEKRDLRKSAFGRTATERALRAAGVIK